MNEAITTFMSWPVWEHSYWGNTVASYVMALAMFLLFLGGIYILRTYILRFLKSLSSKTLTDVDDTVIDMVEHISGALLVYVAFYAALQPLVLHSKIYIVLNFLLLIWVTVQVIFVLQVVIDHVARQYALKATANKTAVSMIGTMVKILIWILGLILVLSNLGINVTSLVTGLGIGGIAVALAVQNILGDLFGYFSIHFDQPFKEGDTVEVGGGPTPITGTIEKIGIKTTRIRSPRGEQIVVPNTQMTSSFVANFKRLEERRVVFYIGVAPTTSNKHMKAIPGLIKTIVDTTEYVRFDRAHFFRYGPSSLDFEIVYHAETASYNKYMDCQQAILLGIKEVFEKEKISFAHPTLTPYLVK